MTLYSLALFKSPPAASNSTSLLRRCSKDLIVTDPLWCTTVQKRQGCRPISNRTIDKEVK